MPTTPLFDNLNGQPVFDVQLQALNEGRDGNGVIGQGDLKVTDGGGANESDVAPGTAVYDGTESTLGSTSTVTHSNGDADDPRWDLVAYDVSTGSVVLREGTPTDPSANLVTPPGLQADEVLLALVYVEAGQTDFGSSEIVNFRVPGGSEISGSDGGAEQVARLTEIDATSGLTLTDAGGGTADVSLTDSSLTVTAGNNLSGGGSVSLGGSTTVDYAPGELGLPTHHVEYAGGLSDEEIARVTVPAGRVLEVYQLDCRLKGGGSDTSISIDIYDTTNATVLASTTAGTLSSGSPLGTSGDGATVLVRLSTGSSGPYSLTNSGIINITDS